MGSDHEANFAGAFVKRYAIDETFIIHDGHGHDAVRIE
jgi:hypothetical protein